MKIIQITDTHLFRNTSEELFGVNTFNNFQKLIPLIVAENPDLLILTGDVSQDYTPESYQPISDFVLKHKINTYWLHGNHDDFSVMQKAYQGNLYMHRGTQLSFLNWNLIFLNTVLEGESSGYLREEEIDKLTSLLVKDNKSKNIGLIMHHHPIPVKTPLIDNYILKNPEKLLAIANDDERIKLLITGHVHGDYTIQQNGFCMETAPATCLQWQKGTEALCIENKIGFKRYLFTNEGYTSEAIYYKE